MNGIWTHIAVFVVGAMSGILMSRTVLPFEQQPVGITDTLVLRDTNIYRLPDIVSEITIAEETVIIEDSLIIIGDSLRVLPMQQRHYKSDDYEIWVSGYRPQLDSAKVFPETVYVTREIVAASKPKRWGVGIHAGYGMSLPNGKPVFAPYVGVGISYSFVRF